MPEFSRREVLGMAGGAALVAAAGRLPSADAEPANPATANPATAKGSGFAPPPAPVPVPLTTYFTNDAIDTSTAHDGNFDGSGYTFPAEALPTGQTTVDGVPYLLGSAAAGANNNVVALGQQIDLPAGRYLNALFLVACSYGSTGGTATVHYADGSTSRGELSGPDWYTNAGPITSPYRYTPGGSTDQSPVSIGTGSVWIDPTRDAVALTLPTTAQPAANVSSLHVFALTLQPAGNGKSLVIRGAHSTTSLLKDAGPQSVEATVLNTGTVWLGTRDGLQLEVDAPGARTVAPAEVRTLAPGEEQRVRIGIDRKSGVAPGTTVDGLVLASAHRKSVASNAARLTVGVPDYQPTEASLGTHQAPYWFDDAKFGIFIHWGVYSVPGWAPVGKEYAEWYWNAMQNPNDPTYGYHAATYGKDFNYDDFIPMFTAAKWNPRSWVELFEDAGADYYALTSKHHEGFALWDSKVSGRNAKLLGPKRDIVKELFAASREYTPHLRNGLYFSLPEWFNPDNPWMGHAPRNPYTLQPVPYTGYQAGRDFVKDYQAPQLLELINGYDPDLIWYDIGGVNDNLHVVADFLNHAKDRSQPKDVTFNNRGGIAAHDFTTPEYTTYPNTVIAKWESSRGLDPFSYGINRATPDDQYMTAEEVVQSLVDIVSKNGNFLLDIGPNFDGTIPQVMQDRLRSTGAWLRVNGESIYGTTYWARMAQLGSLRFTVKQNEAFYISSLDQPGDKLIVEAPVPIKAGDRVTLLGYQRPLDWTIRNGSLVISVPKAAQRAGQYAWVFKIAWR
jgi:alpha-L-fucosidase